jgi:squalene synthase HpnD
MKWRFMLFLRYFQPEFRVLRTPLDVIEPVAPQTVHHAPESAPEAASGSSFYTAMRILPRDQREGMYEIYSFCRQVDDIADSGGPSPLRLAALEKWRSDINALYGLQLDLQSGLQRNSQLNSQRAAALTTPAPHLAKLARVIARFSLERADFIAVIDGMEMDVVTTIVAPDVATLDLYCDRVASAVGRLSVKVFGMPQDAGSELSYHLGRALQLTNILRDIDEDAAIGRVYLPREALLASKIDPTPAAVQASVLDAVCKPLVAQARQHFDASRAIIARSPRRTVIAPAMMADKYHALLGKLAARGFAPPRQYVRISKLHKAKLAFTLLRHAFL